MSNYCGKKILASAKCTKEEKNIVLSANFIIFAEGKFFQGILNVFIL